MKIRKAINKKDLDKNFLFFKKMWKELFDIDFDKNLEKQKNDFEKSEIYFIEENGKIICSSQLEKFKKGEKLTNGFILEKDSYVLGKIGTLKNYRGKGLASKLIKFLLEQAKKEKIEDFYIPSELGNIKFYSKFGFKEFGEAIDLGNTKYIYMKKTKTYETKNIGFTGQITAKL